MSQKSNKSAIHPLENSRGDSSRAKAPTKKLLLTAKSRGSRVGRMTDLSIIYLDYAASTPVDKRVNELMADISVRHFGNASSVHSFGLEAKSILEEAREKIAGLLSVKSDEIIFTSSGTESVNLAIFGIAHAYQSHGKHIVTSKIEHLSVLNTCRQLEKEGFKIDYVPVEKNGIVDPVKIIKTVRPDTVLVSVQYANNEIGTIQPIREIAKKLKMADLSVPVFHTDACQAAGFLNIRPEILGVDMLSFNGSKIYGPKGIGVLFKKSKIQLEPMFYGGSQERGLRAGTENIALTAGIAFALELVEKNKGKEAKRLAGLRDWLIEKIQKEIPETKLNGDAQKRLSNNINISFKDIDGEILMLGLNRQGFAISTGSACTISETGPSHVISALGATKGWGNLRITLGRGTTHKDLEKFLEVLKKEVERRRKIT
ncbi:MAG: cysteine desulfurase family protein [bacterium]|nr:cysteine desulfurase family protein [bacterium]